MDQRHAAVAQPSQQSVPPRVDTAQTAARQPQVAGGTARPRGRAWLRGLALALAYALVTILLTWPIVTRLADHLPALGDPVDSAWRLGWGQYQLLHHPLRLFDANVFYPY